MRDRGGEIRACGEHGLVAPCLEGNLSEERCREADGASCTCCECRMDGAWDTDESAESDDQAGGSDNRKGAKERKLRREREAEDGGEKEEDGYMVERMEDQAVDPGEEEQEAKGSGEDGSGKIALEEDEKDTQGEKADSDVWRGEVCMQNLLEG